MGTVRSLMLARCFGTLLACSTIAPSPAQQVLGPAIEHLPPFADRTLDSLVQQVLVQMDAFHADSSMRYLGQALTHLGPAGDPEARCYLLAYRAEVLYYEGLFNEAMRDLNEAEGLAFQLEDSTLIANVLNLKGLLHENIQDSREALPFLRKALVWFPDHPKARYPVTELHHIHGNLGSYLSELGRTDSAGMHLLRSLELAESAKAQRAIAVAHWSLGGLALRGGLADSALACYERGTSVALAARDHDIGVDARVGRALALAAAGREQEAIAALQDALSYLDEHRAGIGLVTQRNFARMASRTWRELGDLNNAFEQLGTWHAIDSLITARNIRTALNTQAELLRADQALALARLEQERLDAQLRTDRLRQRVIIGAVAVAVLILTVVFLLNSSRLRHKQQLAASEVKRLQHERTIADLELRERLGRDMHDDLGAGLSTLKLRTEMALRSEKDPQRQGLLKDLAGGAGELIASMRQIIWALNDERSSLEELVVYIGSYARTYLDDHGLKVNVRSMGPWPMVHLSGDLRRNIFLIVKEALHNVIKHARASSVHIDLEWRNGLQVTIRDDGAGFEAGSNGGNGIGNMRKRAGSIGAELEITGTAGTRVRLRVPLREDTNLRSIATDRPVASSS